MRPESAATSMDPPLARTLEGQKDGAGVVRLSLGRLTTWLLVAVALLIAVGIVASYFRFGTQYFFSTSLVKTFNLNLETNVPTWFSSLLLFVNGLLLALIAGSTLHARDRWRYYWCGLALIFVYLSMDEAAMFHDRTTRYVRAFFDLSGAFYYAWVVPAMACLAVFALLYFRFLLALPRRTKWLFIAAAGLYVGGALGMEMVTGMYNTSVGHVYQDTPLSGVDLTHDLLGLIEESLEMLGMVLFFYALSDYIQRRWKKLTLRFEA